MRIIIDTEKERIIVPDSFFNQIDKMNKVLEIMLYLHNKFIGYGFYTVHSR